MDIALHRSLPLLSARAIPTPPRSARLSLTDRCDLACVYCRPHRHDGYLEDRLENAAWEVMIAGLKNAGVVRVRLTGGEPLLHPEVVSRVRFLVSQGFEDIAMTTNATTLARLAKPLREAGLQRLTVSLDTLDAARFDRITRGGKLAHVLEGIDAACAARFPELKLNTVVLRGENEDELPNLVRFAWERGIVPRFIEVMKIGEGANLPEHTLVTVAEMRERLAALLVDDRALVDPDRGPARYVVARHDPSKRVGFISGTSDTYCEGCDRLRVSADGALRPCLATNDGVNAAAIARAGDVAGVTEALAEAWSKKPDGASWKGCTEDSASQVSMRAIGGLAEAYWRVGRRAGYPGTMRRALLLFALVAPLLSCSAKKPSTIVLGLTTEAPPPTITGVRIDIYSGGALKQTVTYPLSETQRLPGTLVINKDDDTDDDTPVRIQVTGIDDTGTNVALRSATLGFSDQKQKLLRMPIQFACFGIGCASGESCRAGACVAESTGTDSLPDFEESQVIPQPGACFDRSKCVAEDAEHETTLAEFQAKVAADPTFFDTVNCTVPTDPSSSNDVNMGFVWKANVTGKWTAVDFDPSEGWQFSDSTHTRIKLAPGLCAELQKPDPRIATLVTAAGCPPKPPTVPECAPPPTDGGT